MASQHTEHIMTSPHYPQSNGSKESNVKTVKEALTKCQTTKQDRSTFLFHLRSNLIGPYTSSAQEILHNRTGEKSGQPLTHIDMEKVRNFLIEGKALQKEHYDRRHRTRDLPPL